MLSRRTFISLTGAAAGLSVTRLSAQRGRGAAETAGSLPPSIQALTSMRDRAKPITVDERRVRIERAKKLMAEHKLDAIVLAGGTSLVYFTGMRWGDSERLFAVVIPRVGNPYVVCPAFEEDRAREQLALGPLVHTDVATWQEDESPFERVAQGLKDRGIATGRLGVEETTKFVFADSIAQRRAGAEGGERDSRHGRLPDDQGRARGRADAPGLRGHAEVLRGGVSRAPAGHDAGPRSAALIDAAYARLGFAGGASVQVGEYTALPHGSHHAADDPRRHRSS